MSVDIIREAKLSAVPVTCEVTPHHLLLSSSMMTKLGSKGIVNPPLRSQDDIAGLWQGVEDGTVDVLASDHAPHEDSEKESESSEKVSPGFPGLEIIASTMLTQVNLGRMSLSKFSRMTSTNPAMILGLRRRGRLKEGYCADLIIVEPKTEDRIDPLEFESKAKYSPFEGYKTKGSVTTTMVGGHVVMENREIVTTQPRGKIIKRQP